MIFYKSEMKIEDIEFNIRIFVSPYLSETLIRQKFIILVCELYVDSCWEFSRFKR